jgi:hypothetical protein
MSLSIGLPFDALTLARSGPLTFHFSPFTNPHPLTSHDRVSGSAVPAAFRASRQLAQGPIEACCSLHKVCGASESAKAFRRETVSPMKTIQATVTRNLKEDPSIPECDIWNIESVLLERVPDQARLTADPKEIHVEQISESRLDRTRTVLTLRTRGRCPLRAGDTIHIKL